MRSPKKIEVSINPRSKYYGILYCGILRSVKCLMGSDLVEPLAHGLFWLVANPIAKSYG